MSLILSEGFLIAVASLGCAGFSVLLAHCYRLKYSTVNICGMSCTRDIELENESYQLELEHPPITPTRDIIPSPR
jgi:hypothetical protein